MNYEFESTCKNWNTISPKTLFHAKINKCVTRGKVLSYSTRVSLTVFRERCILDSAEKAIIRVPINGTLM